MKKFLSLFFGFVLLGSLVGCNAAPEDQYPLVSVSDTTNGRSYIYKAENKSVSDVADEISNNQTPDQESAKNDKQMFLAYSDKVYNIQQDPQNSSNTIIEVDDDNFVKHNYDHSFLDGFLTATVLNHIFSGPSVVYTGSSGYHGYSTYSSGSKYSSTFSYHTPTTSEQKATPPLTVRGSSGGFFSGSSSSSKSKSGSSFFGSGSSSKSYSSKPSTSFGSKSSFSSKH